MVHPGLSAAAAYNTCHAVSQVTHQVIIIIILLLLLLYYLDACGLLGHAPTTGCSLGSGTMKHLVADAVSLTPVAFLS